MGTNRIKIKKVPEPVFKLIPVRGSDLGTEWPNDVKEIEVEDGVVYDVLDFYRVMRDEEQFPEALVALAIGKHYTQAELWQAFRRENSIYFFVAKLAL